MLARILPLLTRILLPASYALRGRSRSRSRSRRNQILNLLPFHLPYLIWLCILRRNKSSNGRRLGHRCRHRHRHRCRCRGRCCASNGKWKRWRRWEYAAGVWVNTKTRKRSNRWIIQCKWERGRDKGYDDDVVMYTVAGKPLNLLTNLDSTDYLAGWDEK